MTLELYTPEKLDRLALQLLDLAAIVRNTANRSREHDIAGLPLHDKKAREWSASLDRWVRKAEAEMDLQVRLAMAGRRGLAAGSVLGRFDGRARREQ